MASCSHSLLKTCLCLQTTDRRKYSPCTDFTCSYSLSVLCFVFHLNAWGENRHRTLSLFKRALHFGFRQNENVVSISVDNYISFFDTPTRCHKWHRARALYASANVFVWYVGTGCAWKSSSSSSFPSHSVTFSNSGIEAIVKTGSTIPAFF